jgi:hypothetical protein
VPSIESIAMYLPTGLLCKATSNCCICKQMFVRVIVQSICGHVRLPGFLLNHMLVPTTLAQQRDASVTCQIRSKVLSIGKAAMVRQCSNHFNWFTFAKFPCCLDSSLAVLHRVLMRFCPITSCTAKEGVG